LRRFVEAGYENVRRELFEKKNGLFVAAVLAQQVGNAPVEVMRQAQRRFAIVVRGIDFGVFCQQEFHLVVAAVFRRPMQRRPTIVVRSIDVSTVS